MKRLLLFFWIVSLLGCSSHDFDIPTPIGKPNQEKPSEEDKDNDTDNEEDKDKGENPGEEKPGNDNNGEENPGGENPGEDTPGEEPEDPKLNPEELLERYPLIQQGKGTLIADGDDAGTYDLITRQGYAQEAPDQSGDHASAPWRHIRQSFNEEIQRWVFEFYIHVENDDDRGKSDVTDRQRNELKTGPHSPEYLVAREGETLEMRWKFRLPEGMKTTKKFCHVHQLKGTDNSEGTADVSLPLITFTPRSSDNKQLFQVIFVPPSEQGSGNQYLAQVDLKEFLGEWVTVTERVTFAQNGSYDLTITRMSDDRVLVRVSDQGRNFWRTGAPSMRPKWGIYRNFGENGSIKNQLRDEVLLFADFEVIKLP